MNNGNDESLQKAVDRLARDIAPQQDLWPGIAARIARQQRGRRLWAYGLAASLLVAVGAASLWYGIAGRAPESGVVPQLAAAASPDAAYFAQRAAYAENSVETAPNLAPATRAVILKNLRVIEGSMQQIEQALEQDPNNPRLRALLYDLYQNEARLLAATQQIQAQSTQRNAL
ncbi:MAG TPA: hypothetical protein VGT99_06690 [Gammaproteobacteria bacterium]|nr:hypothetical protein [Gammaproteobacteria bacterium]